MPSTLTGLLLFLALLLPGFAFVTLLRRGRPGYRPSALQETASIAVASVLAELAVLGVFVLVHVCARSWTPDVGQLIARPRDYLAAHYLSVFGWAAGLLLAACVLASVAGSVLARRPVHESTVSSWWTLFEDWNPGTTRRVQCELDDGSYVAGELADWNTWAEDSPDRDIILKAPITYRPAGSAGYHQHPVSAVCVSARRIVTMFVAYSDAATSAASTAAGAAEVEARSGAAQQLDGDDPG